MVFKRYGCSICRKIYEDINKAEECEKKGELPILPEGTLFINQEKGHKDLISILGEKTGIKEETHENTYRVADLMESTPTNFYRFSDGIFGSGSNFKKVENPREELKDHQLFNAVEIVLNKGVYDGLIELTGDEGGTIARFKRMYEKKK